MRMYIENVRWKVNWRDSPVCPVVTNSSCSAEDAGSSPDQGTKVSHALGQLQFLSPCKDTTKTYHDQINK